MEDMNLFEAMYSQRSITRFRPDPVPKEAIDKIIEAATQAPSGGNLQHWEFIAITDPEVIAQVGNLYREVWLAQMGAQSGPDESPVYRAARHLANHMPEVPAMIVACVDHSKGYAPPNSRTTCEPWPLRVVHLASSAEFIPGGTGPGAGHPIDHLPHSGRTKNQGYSGNSRPRGSGDAYASRLPQGKLWSHAAAAGRTSYVVQPLRQAAIIESCQPTAFSSQENADG